MPPSLDVATGRIDLDDASNESPPAHRILSPGLTRTLRGFLYATAAASLAAALALANEARRFDAVAEGRLGALGRLADAEEASEGVVGVFSLCGIVVAVLTIIWWYQAYQAIERTGVASRRWSSGWAVGGWFIPFANLIIPKLVLDEIDRVSAAAAEAENWRRRRVLRVSNWWWGCFVASSVILAIGSAVAADQVERGLPDPDLYSSALTASSAGFTVSVAAALFGAAALRVIGERLSR